MKLIFSHPTGNANVRAAGIAFLEAGLLAEFHTSIASFAGDLLDQLGGLSPLSEIRRRQFDRRLKPYTYMWPWHEIMRLSSIKMGFSSLIKHEVGPFSVDAVYHSIDRRVATQLRSSPKQKIDGIYGYEDGVLDSFREAKRLGLFNFYDLPTGHWRAARRLLEAERERRPEWASTITGFSDSESKLARKDEELRLSDRIFVASRFSATTLMEFPGSLPPIEVIPYGFPSISKEQMSSPYRGHSKLKLLFVGKLSQQKGIADLFEAIAGLQSHVALTVVGRKARPDCQALNAALKVHTWIPSLPNEEVKRLMGEHDILVFPSLFDGFGLVITEAMSQGTPVITTERTAGPDLIKHGENGWLYRAGYPLEFKALLEDLLKRPKHIVEVGEAAKESASKRPWIKYQMELCEAILKPR